VDIIIHFILVNHNVYIILIQTIGSLIFALMGLYQIEKKVGCESGITLQ